VLRPPKRHLATFGNTDLRYFLVTEPSYQDLVPGGEESVVEDRGGGEREEPGRTEGGSRDNDRDFYTQDSWFAGLDGGSTGPPGGGDAGSEIGLALTYLRLALAARPGDVTASLRAVELLLRAVLARHRVAPVASKRLLDNVWAVMEHFEQQSRLVEGDGPDPDHGGQVSTDGSTH
jgi:hypothetical protein